MVKVATWMPVEVLRSNTTSNQAVDQVQRARWFRTLEQAFLSRQPVKNGVASRSPGEAGMGGAAPAAWSPAVRSGLEASVPGRSLNPYADPHGGAAGAPASAAGDAGASLRAADLSGGTPAGGAPRLRLLEAVLGDRLRALRPPAGPEKNADAAQQRQWQQTEVTVAAGEQGATVSIRDAALAKLPREVLRRLVAEALAQQGLRLDALLCNGVAVPV